MNKRTIFYICLYAAFIALTATFITTSYFFPNTTLQSFTAVFIIAWLPLIFFTVLSNLPQTIAGNVFIYFRMPNGERKTKKLQSFCSQDFLDSDICKELLSEDIIPKIRSVSVNRDANKERTEENKKRQYYLVTLKNFTKYSVEVSKKDREKDLSAVTGHVVTDIKLLTPKTE